MTSENPAESVTTTDATNADLKTTDQQEEPEVEQSESAQVEIPKRGGRKRREITAAISDVKAEHMDNEHAVDTQPLFEQPVILEGKRSRKPTSRLELSDLEPPKKEFSIPQGHGKPLGEIEYINHQITHATTDALSHMRGICFGRRGSKTNMRESLREFNGFEFDKESDEYQRHLTSLTKWKKDQLQSTLDILGLPVTGRNDEQAERILTFLMNPIDEGKPVPEQKMSTRPLRTARVYSKEPIKDDDDDAIVNDDDSDELFNEEEDEEDAEENESDDDYIGSDDDSGLMTKDDPDDFAYQPGKKTPKKRTSLKRSRSASSSKRKRVTLKATKRGRKRTKVTSVSKAENEGTIVPPVADESKQNNDKNTDQADEENSSAESKNSDLTIDQSEQNDTKPASNPTSDVNVFPTTS
ncbi:unnamed protein product [Adineta ricciae]|uniref:Uncharacterized protein n=1 Tax=Adineta ricciae TaxID=249248 RepID=A0A815CUK7_ADIRI|nr:unnamed protein product [Adineta ricciae]